MDMPNGAVGGKPSSHDVQMVQNRIEQCLQQYMNKKEVMKTLTQENIDPQFTALVWQRLVEENEEFFKAYHLKLLVKDQIVEFNRLLSEQVKLMHHHQMGHNGVSPMLTSNGLPLLQFTRRDVMQQANTLFMPPNSKTTPKHEHLSSFDFRTPFSSTVGSNSSNQEHPLFNNAADSCPSFGLLGELPNGFDLLPDFSNDLLESYCSRPATLITDHFLDPEGDYQKFNHHGPESERLLRYQSYGGGN